MMRMACSDLCSTGFMHDLEVLESYKDVNKMGHSDIFITNATIYTPFQEIQKGSLHIRDGKIVSVSRDEVFSGTTSDAFVFDASGLMVVPGFIDIHVHGGGGYEIMDGSFEGLEQIARVHASGGTTSMLGSTWAAPGEDLEKVGHVFSDVMNRGTKGARFLGLHVESPYIDVEKRGAQKKDYIRLPDFEEFVKIYDASGGNVKRITVAPELSGAVEFIEKVADMAVEVSIGHTSGTYEDALKAIDAGATSVTHLFNVMNSMHHREPGIVGAALTTDLKVELIADGIHLHPAILKLVAKIKGNDTILVTDSMRATCMPDGEYHAGGQVIIVKDGVARLQEGNLAGSTLTMNKAVKNMVTLAGIDLLEALQMATVSPARLLRLEHVIGSLEPDKLADVVVMDKEYNVLLTIVEGKVVYKADA